jgi:hypothetical protein
MAKSAVVDDVVFTTNDGLVRVRHPDGAVCCDGRGCGDCGACHRDCLYCSPPYAPHVKVSELTPTQQASKCSCAHWRGNYYPSRMEWPGAVALCGQCNLPLPHSWSVTILTSK